MSSDKEAEAGKEGMFPEKRDGMMVEEKAAAMEALAGVTSPYQVSQDLEDWRRVSVDTGKLLACSIRGCCDD